MNNTKLNCSMNDTTVLRNLILENPELPVLIFCGEEAHDDDYGYSQANASKVEIERLTLHGDMWVDEDDYRERLSDDLCDEDEYRDMTEAEFDKMLGKKVEETEFVRAIVIWVG